MKSYMKYLERKSECVKIQNAYHFVIQTTVGRKNLDDIKDVPEILRFALDDKMIWNFCFYTPSLIEIKEKPLV